MAFIMTETTSTVKITPSTKIKYGDRSLMIMVDTSQVEVAKFEGNRAIENIRLFF